VTATEVRERLADEASDDIVIGRVDGDDLRVASRYRGQLTVEERQDLFAGSLATSVDVIVDGFDRCTHEDCTEESHDPIRNLRREFVNLTCLALNYQLNPQGIGDYIREVAEKANIAATDEVDRLIVEIDGYLSTYRSLRKGAEPALDPIAHIVPVSWAEVWSDDPGDEWLIEPVIVEHRQHLIYAAAKTGKSLLALEWAAALATGREILDRPASEAVDVLIVDLENDVRSDVRERLEAMGYEPESLGKLHYYTFPAIGALDTALGAQHLDALIRRHAPRLVILDSFARVISGPENDADTVRAYYRHAGVVLKRHRVASIRLDNSGKDETAGARGSSAKRDDVDVVWQLRRRDGGLQLRRDAQRSNIVPEYVNLCKVDDPHLGFVLDDDSWPAGTRAAVDVLDRLGVSAQTTVKAARDAMKDAGEKCSNEALSAAVRYRKRGGTPNGTSLDDLVDIAAGMARNESSDQGGTPNGTDRNDLPG
jgi:hypothetical protein